MQITLNKIAFDVKPVDGALRTALLADPVVARGVLRPVWSWSKDEGKGRYLAQTAANNAIPLPTGILIHVQKPGTNGAGPVKAEGPTAKMAERFLHAVGAKDFGPVVQALGRVVGVPVGRLPLDKFAVLNAQGSYTILMATELQIVELANAARNLSAYVFLPGVVSFAATAEATGGAILPDSPRLTAVIPPGTQAGQAMRRLALAQRLGEMQAELGETKPADLPEGDPRRAVLARLGAEWKALQAKVATKAA
ncbi:hypothetical protein Rumeso_03892 [Rubellimicrobium mesophilum DSM 19309]|uniref:Uncharacterized protein n=1 Tax=Rubellimicrobium mesophilum DSM 19309 TaxID=442562 RepID=A0A017HJS9_9RHOB|nr:hypothetical protein [Rubellimicrobium mesophilum]EYD74596.1 hypothetical protein Rumeso_03892 [Rubellimicrobium mesophilum DSM 19309]